MNLHRVACALLLIFLLPSVARASGEGVGSSIALPQSVSSFAMRESAGTKALNGSPRPSITHPGGYSVFHSFGNGDGTNPQGGVLDIGGVLYGTTYNGNATGPAGGYLFAIALAGGAETELETGGAPTGDLIYVNGEIYGTSAPTVGPCCGFVYAFNGFDPASVINFPASLNTPVGNLVYLNGNLYGVSPDGGTNGGGAVFVITPRSRTPQVLHWFGTPGDGAYPYGGLVAVNGVLYGTTGAGGANSNITAPNRSGGGTVFSITTRGVEKVLHSFSGPAAPLAALIAVNGELYGTASNGGEHNDGFIFKISTSGTETHIHDFKGTSDGAGPNGVLYANGVLYVTTAVGGRYQSGTLCAIDSFGNEAVLHSFGAFNGDGTYPGSDLISVNGVVYGTTTQGGSLGGGTIFSYY